MAEPAAELLIPRLVEYVVTVPDSLLAGAIKATDSSHHIQHIQAVHEAQAIALAAGLTLGQRRAIVCMESSGLRAGCESIARLTCLHGLGVVTVVSDRGDFGDSNWWAQEHQGHARRLVEMFGWRSTTVTAEADFTSTVEAGFRVVDTRMTSVAIFVASSLLRQVKHAVA